MRNRKRTTAIAALAAVVMLSGCSSSGTAPSGSLPSDGTGAAAPVQESAAPEDSAPAAEEGVRTVTDILGREVTIPAEVDSAAALGSAARYMTYAGAADIITGVSDLEKTSPVDMPYSYVNRERFEKCASVASGGSGDTYYTEELITLSPDLLIVFTSDAEKVNDISDQTGIPAVAIYADSFLDERFTESLRFLGDIAGTEEQAEKCASGVEKWIEELAAFGSAVPEEEKPTVYTGAVGYKGPHGFEGTYANYPPFAAIGARNVADETGNNGAFIVDLEQVAVWDPDIIFLNPSSMYLVNEDYSSNKDFYDGLSAVANGRLYPQPSFNYNSTNMEIAIADAFYAASVLYPESISPEQFSEKADEVFSVMLGQEYLEILDFAGLGYGAITLGS